MTRAGPPAHRRALAAGVAALVACWLLAAGAREAAAGDPDRVWRTIESEHFVIVYPAPLDELGRRVAVVAERAHATLVPALGYAPPVKTVITVHDDTDGANGFANVIPKNAITVFATAPGGSSALDTHDDWLYTLVAHEYSHVLHLDTMEGLPVLYNAIFGKTWSPNGALPKWIIEGLATYEESKRSAGGRTRNSEFDAYLRVPILEGKELRLDQINSGTRIFPRGNTAYLHGSSFLRYIFDRFGDGALARMNHESGAFPLPYAVNRQILRTVGESFPALYDAWTLYLRDRYSLQAMAVERRGVRQGRALTTSGETNVRPRYTPDGKALIWFSSDGHRIAALRQMPIGPDGAEEGKARQLVHLDALGGFDVLGDGSLVFEQSRSYGDTYQYQDLFRWDRASGEVAQLTRMRRARDPAVSPDERWVAYSQNGASTSVLAVMPLAPDLGASREVPGEGEGEGLVSGESVGQASAAQVLWRGERYDQAYQPAWSPDGKTLAFSAWRSGGYRDILLVDVATRQVTEVTRDRALDTSPVFSPDGKWLYFDSDRSGISNLYAWDRASGELWQVTDELGGAYEPAVSPDGGRLAYRGTVTWGYDLYELAVTPERWQPALPFLDDRPDPIRIADDEVRVSVPRPYRPLESLAPPAWTYEALASAKGSYTMFRTSGIDTASLHSYSLAAGLMLPRGELNVSGSYAYFGLRPGLRLSGARTIASRASGYRVDNKSLPYRDEIWSGSASLSLPGQRKPGAAWFLSLDYSLDYTRLVDKPDDSPDPNDILPRVPLTDYRGSGLGMRLSYSSLDATLYGVGPQTGVDLSLSTRVDLPELGATYRAITAGYTLRGFAQLPEAIHPFGFRPSVAGRLAGSIRAGDLVRTGSYGLGGFPEQDLISAVLDRTRASSTGLLRGYPARAVFGNQYHLWNGEARQALWNVERGLSTLPIYVQRLHVAALWDAAAAWDDEVSWDDVRTSIGGALRLDLVMGYFVTGTLEVGYAHGLTKGGVGDAWLLLTGTL